MDEIGRLKKANGRYEFSFDELDLVVRGAQAEWVLEAATEIIMQANFADMEGQISELETLMEMGEADEIDLDILKDQHQSRFERMPQCVVSMGDMDYRWIAPEGRDKSEDSPESRQSMERLIDQSATRNNTFLSNVDGAFDRAPNE
ncbi:MAG: hypothetical protein AAGC81_19860 [Pseudomonadota bacterium]